MKIIAFFVDLLRAEKIYNLKWSLFVELNVDKLKSVCNTRKKSVTNHYSISYLHGLFTITHLHPCTDNKIASL